VGPPRYPLGKVAVDALVDACQIVDIPLLRICECGCIWRIVSIFWIQEKLEVLLDAKVRVVRIGRKPPREKVAVSLVVCEYCIDLVCEAVSWCSWPVLDSLRPCPFWCRGVCYTSTFAMSAPFLGLAREYLLVIPKSIPTMTSGFHAESIIAAVSREFAIHREIWSNRRKKTRI
jgi:hypothetical protein